VFEDFILEVVLDVARHHNKRLPHEVEKHSAQKCHQENQPRVDEDCKCEHLEKVFLQPRLVERVVDLNIVDDLVNGMANKESGENLECVRDNYKDGSEDQVPFVFEEVLVEISEFFHFDESGRQKPAIAACKSNYKKWLKQFASA
jgi:hypothetical protein